MAPTKGIRQLIWMELAHPFGSQRGGENSFPLLDTENQRCDHEGAQHTLANFADVHVSSIGILTLLRFVSR